MLKVNLESTENYIGTDFDKLSRSLVLLETAVNSDRFRQAILNFDSFEFTKYKCRLFGRKEIQLETFTNQQVYDIVLSGHRTEGADTFMDMQLVLSESGGGSAIGATDGNDVTTTYRNAFDRMSDAQLAAHLMHEWTHTIGFEHSFNSRCDSRRNCYSVPYAIGNIIEIILTGSCWYGYQYPGLNL